MPPPSSADKRFLERHGNNWRVVVNVPRHLRKAHGTKLKRSLGTDSLAEANSRKWAVVAELKAILGQAKRVTKEGTPEAQAPLLARRLREAKSDEERWAIEDKITDLAERIAGTEFGQPDDGDPEDLERALDFVEIANGRAHSIEEYYERYVPRIAARLKPRTLNEDRRAITTYLNWAREHHVPLTVEAVTAERAVDFVDHLATRPVGSEPVTVNKYVSRLTQFWKNLKGKEKIVSDNPWVGLSREVPEKKARERRRPFTDDELRRLLSCSNDRPLADLMRIAALTGARIDVIVSLTVGDCKDGLFRFEARKKEVDDRMVPIHSSLNQTIEGRSRDRDDSDWLFPEWPPSKATGSPKTRSNKASQAFTDYRRSLGIGGAKGEKSLVTFHSFRHWFTTTAEHAGQPESTIQAVVGHRRKGETFGRYSRGPSIDQLRACVEAVKLPE
ncbi:MAG: tyrosine-type recombinase/integrase [Pseudomonadota bacterium]